METALATTSNTNKLLFKSITIIALVLLLLIPAWFVQELIEEREQRQREAVTEVSSKWAGKQLVSGPMLAVPYLKTVTDTARKSITTKHTAYLLPDELVIDSEVTPQERSRGIYKVVLYASQVSIRGRFNNLPINKLKIDPEKILWNEAFITMDIGDVKGLNDELKVKWNDSLVTLAPQAASDEPGMTAPVFLDSQSPSKSFSFAATVGLNGSESLQFVPIGKATTVNLQANWPHPSFTGNTLPQTWEATGNGFTATWKSLAHKRRFPQYWTDESYQQGRFAEASFGVDLFIPVNGYQKTMRSVKYAALCIVLTFAAFFLIETVNRKQVHPLQYGLIGLALILFYMLLLSFSEYIGFNTAYCIAATATIALIGWFVKGILASGKLSGILALVLMLVYVYVFTILQLQDFALLLGSIGLFASLAVVMYFSKKLNW